jgi:hypothetical protein
MSKEPTSTDTHKILANTVKFNQGYSDAFFSVKKHALVASDEGSRKLQRERENEAAGQARRVPADPESRRKRLDEALEEADRQTKQLEASSASRSGLGWLGVLPGGMGGFGVAFLGVAAFWYWKHLMTSASASLLLLAIATDPPGSVRESDRLPAADRWDCMIMVGLRVCDRRRLRAPAARGTARAA